ncbi:uncharacterized protein [Leptinotarsa decemlineata]|uniref:uncharacterized protein n=1 Tax=Leptinotarsa decemlineata TaxID=7539 RepID=UPI003D305287
MSWKQGHDCYTDNIKVKISERYKPPPRINIAVTYAQSLIINKQTQDNIPKYEFTTERNVLDSLRNWKSVRATAFQERRTKIEKAREEMKRVALESAEQLDEVELKTVQETAITTCTNNNFIPTYTSVPFSTSINQSCMNYSTNNSILVPTQATNHYSHILTPVPLQNNENQQYSCKQHDKSPFNISDFENDTSSPFDNMELKSINDMEELAQVLNKEKKSYEMNTPVYSNFPNAQPTSSQVQPQYVGYPNNQFYNIPPSISYMQPPTTDYSQTNGYYYPQNQPLQQQYFYSKPSTVDYRYGTSIQSTPFETKSSNCRSVPDIVKALEDEMENTCIGVQTPKNSFIRTSVTSQNSRPKSTDAVYPRPKIKTDQLDDPFDLLTIKQQEICRQICSMGFPLPRVARTYKIFGNDQKKMVEHLLALTDLLDLGFPEKDVSDALVQCDNDRDKALDKLIS